MVLVMDQYQEPLFMINPLFIATFLVPLSFHQIFHLQISEHTGGLHKTLWSYLHLQTSGIPFVQEVKQTCISVSCSPQAAGHSVIRGEGAAERSNTYLTHVCRLSLKQEPSWAVKRAFSIHLSWGLYLFSLLCTLSFMMDSILFLFYHQLLCFLTSLLTYSCCSLIL